jgi:hypothetical protein
MDSRDDAVRIRIEPDERRPPMTTWIRVALLAVGLLVAGCGWGQDEDSCKTRSFQDPVSGDYRSETKCTFATRR